MVESVASSAEAGTPSSSTGRMLHLLDEHKMIVISLFLIAIANHAWAKRSERHRNERRSENRRRAVEEKRREAEKIWSHMEVKALQAGDPQKPQVMHGVANASSSTQHTETLPASPSSRSGQVIAATDRSRERRRRGRDVSKEVRRKGSKKSVVGNGKSPTAPDELDVTRSVSQSSGTTSYDRRNPSCSSSAPRSAFDFEDETARSGTSGRSPEHDPLDGEVALTMASSSHFREDDGVHSTTMHDRDTTLKPSASEYDAPESVHVYDTETRSSMSDSVSSLGISSHASSNTSDNGDVSDLQMESVASHSSPYEVAIPPSTFKRSPSPSRVPTPSIDPPAASASTKLLHAQPIPISQPVPSHLQTQLSWLSESQPKKGQYSNLGSRSEFSSKSPTSSSVGPASLSDVNSGWESHDSPIRNVLRSRSPPPRFRSRSRASSSPMLLPSVSSTPASWTNGFETPPPNASLQTQVSAYRGALEAARQRELSVKKEVEQYKQECERLRKEFTEECERRNGRESELQAQFQYALSQLRSFQFSVMANAGTLPQMQHLPIPQHVLANQQNGFPYQTVPHSPFPYPSSYIPQQSQPISSSPPGTAMPLPMPFATAMNSPFPFAPAHYPPARDGFRHPSAPTSNVASPTRESTFSALSLNGFDSPSLAGGLHSMYPDIMRSSMYGYTSHDGLSEQNVDENDPEYISPLEEAILKRPASMRSPSRASGSRSLSGGAGSAPASGPNSSAASRTGSSRDGSRSASVAGGATREGVFTFASLSELGNPQPRDSSPEMTESSVIEGDEAQESEGVDGVDCSIGPMDDSDGEVNTAVGGPRGLSSNSEEQTLDSDTTPRTTDEDKHVT